MRETKTGHHATCIQNAMQAIAENNGATLAIDPSIPEHMLTPETTDEALEWLANGNAICWMDGDYCH